MGLFLFLKCHYRPQRSCGQGYVFTRVCDSVRGGLRRTPPDQADPPWQGEPPPRPGRHPTPLPAGRILPPPGPRRTPPGPGRPPGRENPPGTRQTPWDRGDPPPPDQADNPLPGRENPHPTSPPPPGRRLQHTVNERPVRILLECILVKSVTKNVLHQTDTHWPSLDRMQGDVGCMLIELCLQPLPMRL